MKEEVSQRLGPLPFIMEPMSDELLSHYFFGSNPKRMKAGEQLREDDDFEVIEDEEEEKTETIS